MAPPGPPWAHTRAALARLERASCVGDCVGTECPVCHMPAWVQDAQINRQLENMIQLCSKLRHLLGGDTSDSTEDMSTPTDSDFGKKNKREQIKMWFSPRSRKIRCVLNKNQPVTKSEDLCEDTSSIYDFFPSPPHKKPSKPSEKPAQRQSKKMKKKRLADVNKVWSSEKPEEKGEVEEKTPKEKCVTICSQPVILCTPEPNSPEETLQESIKEAVSSKNTENVEMSPQVKSSEKKGNSEVVCPAQVSNAKHCATETSPSIENETTPLKRGREPSQLPDTSQSKRPRRTERSIIGKSGKQADCLEDLPQDCSISPATEHKTPVQTSSSVLKLTDTVMKTRSSAVFQAKDSPSLSKSPSTPSTSKTCNRVGMPHSPSVLKSPGGNTIARRNYKGETLLHVASIKGDLAAVEELLKNGADPNVKDNAGWTPLVSVEDLFFLSYAFFNSQGSYCDSQTSATVKNKVTFYLFKPNCACFASNIFGLRPVDYAESEKMKSVLMLSVKNESFSFNQPCEAPSPSQQRDGPLVILGSNLTSEQQKLLVKLATVLKAQRCTEFNSKVTHLVIPDAPMPRTVKCMMAVLTGCWVLKFEWVQACLQSTVREQEEKYEIQGGPQRGRLNREQLLPKLFDGCYFYFLGSFNHHQKSDLVELAKAAGGQILVRQPKPDSDVTQTVNTVAYHAESTSDQRFCTQYVIYDVSSKFKPEKIRQGKVWMAPSSWLVDCAMSFQLLPVK
uniref:BRCA1 associated RING domain 1 n=1 Tax=Calidris pygmaea TaxID=425635 RepID=A0A8C3PJD4_9CHAR